MHELALARLMGVKQSFGKERYSNSIVYIQEHKYISMNLMVNR